MNLKRSTSPSTVSLKRDSSYEGAFFSDRAGTTRISRSDNEPATCGSAGRSPDTSNKCGALRQRRTFRGSTGDGGFLRPLPLSQLGNGQRKPSRYPGCLPVWLRQLYREEIVCEMNYQVESSSPALRLKYSVFAIMRISPERFARLPSEKVLGSEVI